MKLKTQFSFLSISALAIAMASCGSKNDGPMLKGHVEGVEEITIAYCPNGDLLDSEYIKITPDSVGNFEFNPEFPEGVKNLPVDMYVGDGVVGAYLEKGKTTDVNLTVNQSGAPEVEYTGDNIDVNKLYNESTAAFDIMRYFALDPEDAKTKDEYRALLDSEYQRLLPFLDNVKDSKKKDFFSRYINAKYDWMKARIILDQAGEEGKEPTEYPEFVEIASRIDPNDDISGTTNLTYIWMVVNNPDKADFSDTSIDGNVGELEFIDKNITNPAIRRMEMNQTANSFFVYKKPSKEEGQGFMEAFRKYAANYPELIEKYENSLQMLLASLQPGDMLSYLPKLETPEGETVDFKDLLGKVIYIDVWATWCGPCQRQIPYFAKVAERFKGNDKIEVISISVDQDKEAWLDQLKREKPTWKQYRLTPEENKEFSSALNITGIPRFIIVAPDGTLIAPEAEFPSSEKIDDVLNAAISR